MNKNFIKKFFDFLRSTIHFIKILILFLIIILLLYWIQNLIGGKWNWIVFFKPFLDFLLDVGKSINNSSFNFFGATFEFKYLIALIILIIVYFAMNIVKLITDELESITLDAHKLINKIQEDRLNATLETQNINEQKKLKKYKVYISTAIKKKFSHAELNIDINEQNVTMNKFLIEKFGKSPELFNGGFLFSFSDFNEVDNTIDVLMKLIKSNAPLNYYISVQILSGEKDADDKKIVKLDSLKLENKICMNFDTSYRYRFNKSHRYGVSQIGLFQKDGDAIEVSEFIEIV